MWLFYYLLIFINFISGLLGAWRPVAVVLLKCCVLLLLPAWLVPAGAGRWLPLVATDCLLGAGYRWWQLTGDCCATLFYYAIASFVIDYLCWLLIAFVLLLLPIIY
jgi:hypothetical protein